MGSRTLAGNREMGFSCCPLWSPPARCHSLTGRPPREETTQLGERRVPVNHHTATTKMLSCLNLITVFLKREYFLSLSFTYCELNNWSIHTVYTSYNDIYVVYTIGVRFFRGLLEG